MQPKVPLHGQLHAANQAIEGIRSGFDRGQRCSHSSLGKSSAMCEPIGTQGICDFAEDNLMNAAHRQPHKLWLWDYAASHSVPVIV